MQLKQNARVVNAEGESLAQLDRVVIDPRTKEVTHLVVRQGLVLTEDKVVPIGMVASTDEDEIRLSIGSDELEALPHYEESYFVEPGEDSRDAAPAFHFAPVVYANPPVRGAILHEMPDYPGAGTTLESGKTIPEETIALEKGARVVSQDDQDLGVVSEVIINSEAKRATHFVISRGIFKSDKTVPANWIAGISADEVRLAVPKRVLERLSEGE
jgi:uncharacterized protein YrrD